MTSVCLFVLYMIAIAPHFVPKHGKVQKWLQLSCCFGSFIFRTYLIEPIQFQLSCKLQNVASVIKCRQSIFHFQTKLSTNFYDDFFFQTFFFDDVEQFFFYVSYFIQYYLHFAIFSLYVRVFVYRLAVLRVRSLVERSLLILFTRWTCLLTPDKTYYGN